MKVFNYLMAGVLGMGALAFVSCSSNDEPETTDGGGKTPATPTDTSLLVSSIMEGSNSMYLSKFVYDSENRMVSGTEAWMGAFNYSFSPLQLVINASTEESGKEVYTFKDIRTNEKGYITYAKVENSYEEDGQEYYAEGTMELTYDGDYLTKAILNSNDNGEEYTSEQTLTWNNGNLVKLVATDESVGEYSETDTYTYTYGEGAPKNSGIYLQDVTYLMFNCLFYAGYMGKPCANIPTEISRKYDSESSPYTYAVEVAYDDKNRIVEYKENDALCCVYAYDGKTAVWPSMSTSVQKSVKASTGKLFRHRR